MNWNTDDNNTVSREEAIVGIQDKARDQNLSGSFKVFYPDRNTQIVTPTDLPDRVDMDKVIITATLNQA